MGGQGAQTAYGRTAWSDWNLLTVPVTLAPTDSYFAAQVDFYLPAGSSAQEQRAGMFLFNDPAPARARRVPIGHPARSSCQKNAATSTSSPGSAGHDGSVSPFP